MKMEDSEKLLQALTVLLDDSKTEIVVGPNPWQSQITAQLEHAFPDGVWLLQAGTEGEKRDRVFLHQSDAAELARILQHFADTGKLPDPKELDAAQRQG